MRSKLITKIRLGDDCILCEDYTRPSGGINRFAGIILEEVIGHRLHMFSATRIKACIYISRKWVIPALCIIYCRKYMTGFCVGEDSYIDIMRKILHLKTIISPNPYLQGYNEKREFRRRGPRSLYIYFY